MRPTNSRRAWSADDEHRAFMAIDAGVNVQHVAKQQGRTVRAIQRRCYDNGVRPMHAHARADGMNVADVARELGVPMRSVRQWITRGWLKARRMKVVRQYVYTISADAVSELIAGYPLLNYQPTDDWTPAIEDARATWRARYISRTELAGLLCVHAHWLSMLHIAPIIGRGNGTQQAYHDRAAVRAWLDAHPQYWTRAAREQL